MHTDTDTDAHTHVYCSLNEWHIYCILTSRDLCIWMFVTMLKR